MKKTVFFIIMITTIINIYALIDGKQYKRFTIEEYTKDGKIAIDINYFYSMGKPVSLHIGVNGWNNIQDIYSENGRFELIFNRDISRLDICFNIDSQWDNNNGKDYFYNTSNHLVMDLIKDHKELILVKDHIEETIQTLKSLIIMIENHHSKTQDNIRAKNMARYAIKEGQSILKKIESNPDEIEMINKDFNLFCDIVAGLI